MVEPARIQEWTSEGLRAGLLLRLINRDNPLAYESPQKRNAVTPMSTMTPSLETAFVFMTNKTDQSVMDRFLGMHSQLY